MQDFKYGWRWSFIWDIRTQLQSIFWVLTYVYVNSCAHLPSSDRCTAHYNKCAYLIQSEQVSFVRQCSKSMKKLFYSSYTEQVFPVTVFSRWVQGLKVEILLKHIHKSSKQFCFIPRRSSGYCCMTDYHVKELNEWILKVFNCWWICSRDGSSVKLFH